MQLNDFLRSIFLGGMGKFIHFFFLNWYILVITTAVIALYNLIAALEKRGLTKRFFNFVSHIMHDIRRISMECPAKIEHISQLWDCL